MAMISDQALSLHQYHLRIRTSPRPAPHSIIKAHAPEIEFITRIRRLEITTRSRVIILEITTYCFSVAFCLMNRL